MLQVSSSGSRVDSTNNNNRQSTMDMHTIFLIDHWKYNLIPYYGQEGIPWCPVLGGHL
jgi:hypothetical protein